MKTYVLVNIKTDSYIGLDNASGGYPYNTELLGNAKIWYSKEDAKEYTDLFPNKKVTLHEVTVNTTPCKWD